MEKLIELLNEYDWGELEYTIIDWNVKRRVKNMIDPDKPYKWYSVWWYSKSFWFIEWLVENDKIKLWAYDVEWYHFNVHTYLDLIMLLSIQDNPIEFLCEILK